jgi:plastocyanin
MLRRLLAVSATTLILLLSVGSRFNVAKTQALPAPTVDRVGFPTNYQNTFVKLYTFDNFQNRQIRVVWANPIAASVRPSNVYNFPYGSIILFESYSVQEDANGEPMLDGNGRFMQNKLTTLFVMRKEQGFGVDYGLIRNGEWEYVAYNPDGTYSTPPSGTGSCAACHLSGASASAVAINANTVDIGAQWDYVFRPDLYFGNGTGAVPTGTMDHYVFIPNTIHAQPGQVVTVYNKDQLLHHIVADDNSFDTGVMNPGGSFNVTAGAAGTTISYHCTLHSRMKGKIVVDSPQQ